MPAGIETTVPGMQVNALAWAMMVNPWGRPGWWGVDLGH